MSPLSFWRKKESCAPCFGDAAWDGLAQEPGVGGHLGEGQPLLGVHHQAARDQALHLLAQLQLGEPGELGSADLSIALKGDVATHHVVEEDAQGPDGQALRPVSP